MTILNYKICFLNDNIYSSQSVDPISPNVITSNVNSTNEDYNPSVPGLGKISLYKTFINKTRRRLYWELLEVDKNNYAGYKDFKKNWDNNTKIFQEIKAEIKSDLQKINLNKKTISWFLNVRKHNK